MKEWKQGRTKEPWKNANLGRISVWMSIHRKGVRVFGGFLSVISVLKLSLLILIRPVGVVLAQPDLTAFASREGRVAFVESATNTAESTINLRSSIVT